MCKGRINGTFCAVKNAHRANDVFLCNKAGDGCNRCLPFAPAEGFEDPGDRIADCRKNGLVKLVFRKHSEPVGSKSEVGGKPNEYRGQKNDRARFLDEGPAALPSGTENVADSGKMICGKLHYEGSGFAREHLGFLQHDTGNYDCRHADEICTCCNPG